MRNRVCFVSGILFPTQKYQIMSSVDQYQVLDSGDNAMLQRTGIVSVHGEIIGFSYRLRVPKR